MTVFQALVKGIYERGPSGALYVKGDECAYLLVNEFEFLSKQLVETLASKMASSSDIFVVEHGDDGECRMFSYDQETVFRGAYEEATAASSSASDPSEAE